QVGQRIDRVHAPQRPCGARVDGADQAVRDRAPQERRFEKPRRAQVIDEAAGATNKSPILDARIAASDVWRSTHPEMPFGYLIGREIERRLDRGVMTARQTRGAWCLIRS